MGRLKSLLFKQEIKNRRVAKIKSKLYHKLKKKERERDEDKLKQYMMEVDPEAAKAYQQKEDLRQVEERLRARHGTGTKYAKNLKRFRGMDDKDTRDAYHQAVLDRQALTQRKERANQDSSASDDSDSDLSESELKEKACARMEQEAESDCEMSASDSERSNGVKMDFSQKAKQK